MGTLIVVRHGETAYNAEHRYTGKTDIPLSGKGFVQAEETARALACFTPDILLSSTLLRARQTAQIIADSLGLPVIENAAFREVSFSLMEGLTGKEVREKYSENWEELTRQLQSSHVQSEHIVFNELASLGGCYAGKIVILVTHGFISKLIYKYFAKPDEESFSRYMLPNCGFAKYEF
jgi:2,3-bisphosphoglycerate-dependent phosphoglycerate mutase